MSLVCTPRSSGKTRWLVDGFRWPDLVGGHVELVESAAGVSVLNLPFLFSLLDAFGQKALWGAVGWSLERHRAKCACGFCPRNQERSSRMRAQMFFAQATDGSLVHVTQVPRGLGCNCQCLGCNEPLVAKQGSVVGWHFAHTTKGEVRRCAESALHLAAKEQLQGLSAIKLSYFQTRLNAVDVLGREHVAWVKPSALMFRYGSCELEHRIGNRRLDALLRSEEGLVGVEISVTHAVDWQKAEDLAAGDIPVMEIDLEPFVGTPLDRKALNAALMMTAPRCIVACSDRLNVPATRGARRRLARKLNLIARQVGAVRQLSNRDLELRRQFAAKIGIDADAWPDWLNCEGWMSRQGKILPRRLFGGVHHSVWQAACLASLQIYQGRQTDHDA